MPRGQLHPVGNLAFVQSDATEHIDGDGIARHRDPLPCEHAIDQGIDVVVELVVVIRDREMWSDRHRLRVSGHDPRQHRPALDQRSERTMVSRSR